MKLLLLLACLLCCGAAPQEKAKPAAVKVSSAAQLPDSEIEREIKARFARSKIGANNFQVKVQSGVATLDGTANIVQHKGIATRMARNAGAIQVVNRIRISDSARQKAADQFGQRKATVKHIR